MRSDKESYTGYCFYCDAPIKRITRDRWVRDWRATLHLAPRPPAPSEEELLAPIPDKRRRKKRF